MKLIAKYKRNAEIMDMVIEVNKMKLARLVMSIQIQDDCAVVIYRAADYMDYEYICEAYGDEPSMEDFYGE